MTSLHSPERPRIKVDEEHELKYWMKALGIDEATLRDLVHRKRGDLDRIRLELREMRRRG